MTTRQAQLLAFIRRYTADHNGASPCYEEMREALGLHSKAGINRIVVVLEEQGLIRRLPTRARSIEIVERSTAASALREIINHWDAHGADGRFGILIERSRAAVA